jgi:alpha-glucoside transport system substrate-binding protein
MFKKSKLWTMVGVLVMIAMIISACSSATEAPTEAPPEPEVEETEEMAEPEEEMAEVDFAVIPGGFLEKALAGEYAGTTVTLDGPFVDPDTVFLEQSIEAFEEATGITVNYVGDQEFEGRLAIAVDAGNPPDIADFPQPGLLANYTRQGVHPRRLAEPAVQPVLAGHGRDGRPGGRSVAPLQRQEPGLVPKGHL